MKRKTPKQTSEMYPDLRGYKLCKGCGQPMLKRGQIRKHSWEYRHARGCPFEEMKILPKSDAKQTAKMLADVIRGLEPIYAKHGKKIAGIVLSKP